MRWLEWREVAPFCGAVYVATRQRQLCNSRPMPAAIARRCLVSLRWKMYTCHPKGLFTPLLRCGKKTSISVLGWPSCVLSVEATMTSQEQPVSSSVQIPMTATSRVIDDALLRIDLGDDRSGQPKYERLKEHLVNAMAAGRLKPGQALPSVSQLARASGLAKMTVNQAMVSLENDGLIRREQGKGSFVQADARRKLNRGQDIFALVVPESRVGFYPSLLHGFETAASDVQHQTLICSTDNNVERQADIVLQLLDKEVGGVAMVPTTMPTTPAHQVRQLQKHGVPVVFCHRRVEGISAPLLAIPFRDVGKMAGKAFAENGHQHVVLIDSHRTPVFSAWEEGLLDALQADGNKARLESCSVANSNVMREEDVLAVLKNVFDRPDAPTAIFAPFDSLAEMIYMLLPRIGLRVPEDVSVVGFGGSWRESILARRLTSVVVDEIATGQKAVSLLHELRRGDRPIDDNEEFVLPVGLYEGETLAKPASRI